MIEFVDTGAAILSPLENLWVSFVGLLPSFIAAILLLIVGYLLGTVLGNILRVALQKIGTDVRLHKLELMKSVGKFHLSSIVGELLKWYVFIIFLQAAVDLLELGSLTVVLTAFVGWLPQLIVAIIIILFGLLIAHYVELKIKQHTNVKGVRTSAVVLKWVLVFIVILTALKQIGIEVDMFENAFYLILGALAIGFALAVGIGLGLGMKKNGERIIQKIMDSF